MYYTTAMLWARLLDIKAKRGNTNLTFQELEFYKAVMQHEYNIPQPVYLFLNGIGEVNDATGKTVYLANHQLPVTVVQGSGGYHSNAVDDASHNLYEEIPSIGICGICANCRIIRSGTPSAKLQGATPEYQSNSRNVWVLWTNRSSERGGACFTEFVLYNREPFRRDHWRNTS